MISKYEFMCREPEIKSGLFEICMEERYPKIRDYYWPILYSTKIEAVAAILKKYPNAKYDGWLNLWYLDTPLGYEPTYFDIRDISEEDEEDV